MESPFITPPSRRVWPWDDDTAPGDGLLLTDRLPSPANYGAAPPDSFATDAVPVLVPVEGDGQEYLEGSVCDSDPDNLDGKNCF